MSEYDFKKLAQKYYSEAPVIILGSGASAAFGLSGMGALSEYLIDNVNADTDLEIWTQFVELLTQGIDLESALHQVQLTDALTKQVVEKTWKLINPEDLAIFDESLRSSDYFPLGKLIRNMFRSARDEINIITTNYDRLAEYACEQEGYHHYSGFTHGYSRRLVDKNSLKSQRKVNIWKVHGSLDWFIRPEGDTFGLGQMEKLPDRFLPQIVTPGINKYLTTYREPYRSIISHSDEVLIKSNSYLCIGFGFNDEHIQEKLLEKCVRGNARITVLTWSLTDAALDFLLNGDVENYLAIERGKDDNHSLVYSSLSAEVQEVQGDYWSQSGYLNLIL